MHRTDGNQITINALQFCSCATYISLQWLCYSGSGYGVPHPRRIILLPWAYFHDSCKTHTHTRIYIYMFMYMYMYIYMDMYMCMYICIYIYVYIYILYLHADIFLTKFHLEMSRIYHAWKIQSASWFNIQLFHYTDKTISLPSQLFKGNDLMLRSSWIYIESPHCVWSAFSNTIRHQSFFSQPFIIH